MTQPIKDQANIKRVLVVTYKYYPQIAPRAFRWSSIIREWVDQGTTVDVICAPTPDMDFDFSTFPQYGNVHQIDPYGRNRSRSLPKHCKSVELSQRAVTEEVHSKKGLSPVPPSMNQTLAIPNPAAQDTDVLDPNNPETTSGFGYNPDGGTLYFTLRKLSRLALRGFQIIKRPILRVIRFFLRAGCTLQRHFLRMVRSVYRFFLRGFRAVYRFILRGFRVVYRFIIRTIRRQIKSVIWPDYAMPWIFPATRKARALIRKNDYDGVITVSWPVSPHVVGMRLSHLMKRKGIRWVVDIGDPFSFNTLTPINNFKRYTKKNQRFEKRLLDQAETVTVTTIHTKARYEKLLNIQKENFVVIPPLISIDTNPSSPKQPFFPSEDKLRLVYTGSLRRNNRRPDGLLRLFAALSEGNPGRELELHFFGDIKQCTDAFASYNSIRGAAVFTHGIVSKEINDQVLAEADILVNIGNRAPYQLPSKVVDYIYLNKPILNIASHQKDSSWEFFQNSPLAINAIIKETEEISEGLKRQVQEFLLAPPPPLPQIEYQQLIARYTPDRISADYLGLVSNKDGNG